MLFCCTINLAWTVSVHSFHLSIRPRPHRLSINGSCGGRGGGVEVKQVKYPRTYVLTTNKFIVAVIFFITRRCFETIHWAVTYKASNSIYNKPNIMIFPFLTKVFHTLFAAFTTKRRSWSLKRASRIIYRPNFHRQLYLKTDQFIPACFKTCLYLNGSI